MLKCIKIRPFILKYFPRVKFFYCHIKLLKTIYMFWDVLLKQRDLFYKLTVYNSFYWLNVQNKLRLFIKIILWFSWLKHFQWIGLLINELLIRLNNYHYNNSCFSSRSPAEHLLQFRKQNTLLIQSSHLIYLMKPIFIHCRLFIQVSYQSVDTRWNLILFIDFPWRIELDERLYQKQITHL